MDAWRLPGDYPSPQSPSPYPPAQAPYGWQLDCMEVEGGAPTTWPQTMPRPGHIQWSPDAENAMNPLPNYEMVSPPYPPLYPECQQAHHKPETAGHGVNFGQQSKMNQESFVSPSARDAWGTPYLQENPVGWNLPSNHYGQDPSSFQMDPEVERAAAMVAGGPRDLAAVQTPGTKAAPYPLSPQQVLSPNPMNAALQMPTPLRPSLGKIGPLMSLDSHWFSFDQPMPPVVAEPFPTPGNAHHFNSDLQQRAGGYQQEFIPQLQDVIPAGPHSPKQSPATFKMGPSKEPEHQIQTESMFNPFIQTPKTDEGCSSPDPPQMPIGFETLGHSGTNISDQSSGTTSFPEPPNTYKTDPTLNEAWGLFPPASSMNFPRPDVRTEPTIPVSPISNHKPSPPPRKITSSTSFDSKDEASKCRQVSLLHKHEGSNKESAIFCDFIKLLAAKHPSSETQSNSGLMPSVITPFCDELLWVCRIPLTIVSEAFTEPMQASPYAGSTVEELIRTTLCDAQQSAEDSNDYVLKLCDTKEVLQNACTLGSHESLQYYLKLGDEIRLQLIRQKDLQRVWIRTIKDDQDLTALQSVVMDTGVRRVGLSRKILNAKLNSYHDEVRNLLSSRKSTCRLVEEVKAICYLLLSVETREITTAIQHLNSLVSPQKQTSLLSSQLPKPQDLLTTAINALTAAISRLIHIYCNNFDIDYQVADVGDTESAPEVQAQLVHESFSFNIYAMHGVPGLWAGSYENLSVSCSLKYGREELCSPVKTGEIGITKPSLFHLARWNQRIHMPIEVRRLPCEVTLNLELHGHHTTSGNHPDGSSRQSMNTDTLASVSMALYSSQQILVHGTKLLCLCPVNTSKPDTLVLQIDFPLTHLVRFTRPVLAANSQYVNYLDEVSRKQIANIQQKHSLLLIGASEKNLLWTKRSFCNNSNCFLPLLLGSGLSLGTVSLPEVYAVLKRWSFSTNPLELLGLLLSRFSDQKLRRTAVQQIGTILNDELLDYLPQLVQAIKFEWHLNSPLVEFLLDRSIGSIRVAHQLYWLLKDGLADSQFKGRYSQLLAAVLHCSGQAMQEEFDKETKLVAKLGEVADKIRTAEPSKRMTVLAKELEEIEKFFYQEHVCHLPLNPTFAVKGIDVSVCSYFTSNAVPLKFSFINAEPLGKNINVICKTGDDLRQDMLVLQIVKLMDRIWCQEGLDMSMIIYRCISTGERRGMVEIIPGATTLAKIHMKYGITGPFKDNTLSNWFQEHNPTKEQHERAVENFVYSCAGWCVATFVLGICDRHNDNIMLRTTGHMFHIDFGKFLGHSQMIMNMKRDRVPFIFTAEMEHFITEGGKNGAQFHRFVDLSCQAYNIIRQHTQLLMNLMELMLSAGLPELSEVQDLKHVYNNLRPMDSDVQATSYFTSLIKESLNSLPVKINFFAHIMAQKKVAGAHIQRRLSFVPETYTLQTEGLIRSLLVCGFEKKVSPHKEYFYKVQVEREGQAESTFVERSYSQFSELNKHLHCCFPASEIPRFPHKPLLGLSTGRELARKRKDELNTYVRYLLNGSPQVAKSDLVYTFFHSSPNNERPSASPSSEPVLHPARQPASAQLHISLENGKLSIMVKHVTNIYLPDGSAPDAYVKIYLLPDAERVTKRKTNVVPKNSNPTFNQILEYVGITDLANRVIQLSVWCRQTLLGAVNIPLWEVTLEQERWYRLGNSFV
ncbi:phosphatidylinositol 4-phosphate 3-kinase C2 domain-containing subunit gamma [Amblyraja radiata]|uniref:phosphatidylinositol 4-phosphate 3-kinase C2 domain-containing subunit gamma n=1 Tax=Amblyraja radiata TaxID=386614 RepID=UPI001401CC3A|nr:phosphatidylinositol 4-phosphate 3-kinase C2 domain-containing subunit gamma [Amblyraja radiata]XP_032895408.1 phosphatidylinositol 4-phosphate 3-kinase C2 domain-containing subunit gamma [Amblyraja radiata]